jgi:hypothetical protein
MTPEPLFTPGGIQLRLLPARVGADRTVNRPLNAAELNDYADVVAFVLQHLDLRDRRRVLDHLVLLLTQQQSEEGEYG